MVLACDSRVIIPISDKDLPHRPRLNLSTIPNN